MDRSNDRARWLSALGGGGALISLAIDLLRDPEKSVSREVFSRLARFLMAPLSAWVSVVTFLLGALLALGVLLSCRRNVRHPVPPVTGSIARIDAVFTDMGRLYNAKKVSAGVEGWAHEDLYQLATAFRAVILNLAPNTSHFHDDVKNCDAAYSTPGADAKLRMLSFQGIAAQLREELEAMTHPQPGV
jgi:hypothetical protein